MTSTPPRPGSRMPLAMIFLTVFIDLLGFGIVLPLLPRYGAHFALRGTGLGVLMASFSAMQFVFAPLWGRLSDRVGRRPILMLGLLGSAVFYSLFGFATSLGPQGQLLGLGVVPWLFLCRIGAGIAGATIPTAQAYIADVTTPQTRGKGMALIGAAFGVGFTFGPLLGSMFVSGDVGDAATFRRPEVVQQLALTETQAAAITRVIGEAETTLQARRHEITREERKAVTAERERAIRALLTPGQQQALSRLTGPSPWPGYVAGGLSAIALLCSIFLLPESLKPGAASAAGGHGFNLGSLLGALRQPAMGMILFSMFLTTFAFAQFESTLSLLTAYLGLADRHNYFFYAYTGLVLSLAGFGVRGLIPRMGEQLMSVCGTTMMTLGMLLIALAGALDSVLLLAGVVPLAVVGFSSVTPSLASLLSREAGESDQGGTMGLGQSMLALARILGPLVGLRLNDSHPLWPYGVGGALMAVCVALTLSLRSIVRHPETRSDGQPKTAEERSLSTTEAV